MKQYNSTTYMISMLILSIIPHLSSTVSEKKIIGLMAVRNEAVCIEQHIKALSLYTDAIIVLDDASTDDTVPILKTIAHACNIETIISKPVWQREEAVDRNTLLQAGREAHGTHFIVIDADEMFTANCLNNNYLKHLILQLEPGDQLQLAWIQLWRSVDQYRFDTSVWTNLYGSFIFCDDQVSSYDNQFLHASRIPKHLGKKVNRRPKISRLSGYEYGLMHFQFVNWENLLIKQHWYKCLERIRQPKKTTHDINRLYRQSTNEDNIAFRSAPTIWFTGYTFFDQTIYQKPEQWRRKQILEWFTEYGKEYFKNLEIWNIDWSQ